MNRATAHLHNARVELEALATRRAGMIAANILAEQQKEPPPYTEEHFAKLAEEMRQTCWVDVTTFDS